MCVTPRRLLTVYHVAQSADGILHRGKSVRVSEIKPEDDICAAEGTGEPSFRGSLRELIVNNIRPFCRTHVSQVLFQWRPFA